jgi:hypothetical protein
MRSRDAALAVLIVVSLGYFAFVVTRDRPDSTEVDGRLVERITPRTTTTTEAPTTTTTTTLVTTSRAPLSTVGTVPREPLEAEPEIHAEEPAPPSVPEDDSVEAVVCAVFGPYCADALAVAECESGLNPTAVSATDDHGLFQLHKDAQRVADVLAWDAGLGLGLGWDAVYTPYVNSQLALAQSRGGTDFSSWTCGRMLGVWY